MALTCVIVVLLTSFLALPCSYVLNIVSQGKDQKTIFLAGTIALLLIALAPQYIIRIRSNPSKLHSFIHVLSLLTFNSVMSLIIALENDGLIAEFLGSFLREGEPYLKSAHGTMICYWDGICHYAMYLMMMAAISWNQSFYDVGLYWAGSFGHRFLVLFLAIMTGKDSFRWPVLLYCPFILICIWAAKKFLDEKNEEATAMRDDYVKEKESHSNTYSDTFVSIWKRPADLIFMMFYLAASAIAVFRFTAAMGTSKGITKSYVDKIEPYLDDTLPFSKSEIMVQLFYFVPYYAMSIYGLLHPGQSWVPQWAIIYAGAAGQGQSSYMGSSFHYRTPYIYRVPQNLTARGLFWSINGLLILMPQLMAYKFNHSPDFFFIKPDVKVTENGNVVSSGKDNSSSGSVKKIE